jgi:hypothetical protein
MAWVAVLLLMSIPTLAAPARDLPQITADYRISYLGIVVGRSRLSLEPISRNRYRLRLKTRTVGAIQPLYPLRHLAETRLDLGSGGVRPSRFIWESRLWGAPERQTIRFNWRQRSATVRRQKGQITVPLPAGSVQDRVSLVPAIMFDLAHDGLQESYTLFDGKRLREYPLILAGPERITTAVGELDVVRVERPVAGKPERTVAWLAPALGYLPVRVVHLKGERSTLNIEILSHTPIKQK